MDSQALPNDLGDSPAITKPENLSIPEDEARPTETMKMDHPSQTTDSPTLEKDQNGCQATDDNSSSILQPPITGIENPDSLEVNPEPCLQESQSEVNKVGGLENRNDQATIDTKSKEADEETTHEPSNDEAVAKKLDSSANGKEREFTTKPNDASTEANAPRIGFKHDPAEEALMAAVEPEFDAPKKKKNKKKRPKSQRGLDAPSGFEPFYADAPITPREYEDNKKIYDLALPILDRIDEGIKRFLFKRRLDPHRRKVFLKYLQYGGVSVGQKQNQGVTPQELKEMDKEEAMQARSTTAIFPNEGKELPISFNDVATGYLTGYFMGHYNPETEDDIKICTSTMKNFFTYLLYHEVCPEQTEDLQEARKTCDRCESELWMCQQIVNNDGPGHFNRACSMLFGGYYFETVDDPEAWSKVRWASSEIFTRDIARKVVKCAIALAGDDRMTRKFKCLVEWDNIQATQVQDIDGFEVISIEYPSEVTGAYYRELAPDLLPVGKLKAKEFRDPSRGVYDLAPWEKLEWDHGFAPTYSFEFFVEAPLLDLILPGMKFLTTVYETNFGMHFYDEVMTVLPTNYMFLYNDWMMEYREPKPIEWVGDEQEITRRHARALIVRPPEPSEKAWILHMLTTELRWTPRVTEWTENNPKLHAENIVNALELVGYSMKDIREKLKLKEPENREKNSTEQPINDENIETNMISSVVEEVFEEPLSEEPIGEHNIGGSVNEGPDKEQLPDEQPN